VDRFPPSLVRVATTLFVIGIGASIYLEARACAWLAGHPITVNLISAFICLNAAIVAIDRIVRMFAARERAIELHAPFKQELTELKSRCRPKNIAICRTVAYGSGGGVSYSFDADPITDDEPRQARSQFRDGIMRYLEMLKRLQSPADIGATAREKIDFGLQRIEQRVKALSDPESGHEDAAILYVEIQELVDQVEHAITDQHRRSTVRRAAQELKGRAS
jgi:hypothetical protein